MTSWVDPEDGLREWLALGTAPDADALHRVLVTHRPIRHSADTLEPLGLLRRISQTEPEEVFTTAFLLLTDRRWGKGLSQLVRGVENSDCLDDEQLDELARLFIAADKALFWAVPDEWFGDDEIVIAELDEGVLGESEDDQPSEEGPARVAREVHPPVRRWAAARLVDRDPACVDALTERTGEVDARAGAAIMAGLLDGIDRVDTATRDRLIDEAVTWPDHAVRRCGIELVARRDGVDAAHRLAIRDPNARIRAWAPTLLTERSGDSGPGELAPRRDAEARRDDQQSLL